MLNKPSILVVDDEQIHRGFVAAVLNLRGWKVDGVASGAAAVETFATKPYALVLMDIQMPGMDGLETSAALRAQGGSAAIVPILAFTALDGASLEHRMQVAGMDGHLAKPCTPADLVKAVERWRPTDGGEATERLGAIFGEQEMAQLLSRLRERLVASLHVSEDPAEAQAIAHGLAGVAGTLGFPEVHRHWLALSEGDSEALQPARDAARKALMALS